MLALRTRTTKTYPENLNQKSFIYVTKNKKNFSKTKKLCVEIRTKKTYPETKKFCVESKTKKAYPANPKLEKLCV